jgi:subtilisin family serine protease
MLQLAIVLGMVCSGDMVLANETPDPKRDILVTFGNASARAASAGMASPYQHRKRYSIARSVRRDAKALAEQYSLKEIDHWPIQSLSVYCFVYRIADGTDRNDIVARLNADSRVESAQPLQSFETSLNPADIYDDKFANLQYGLDVLDIAAAHRTSQGAGIRIAIIDSDVDRSHEDLKGRIQRVLEFTNRGASADRNHGTAIVSVIGARSNNAIGIVGIAPEATLELYVSCWSGGVAKSAVCDSFSLSKGLDAMLENPPDVLNLSLTGPRDSLLERLIRKAIEAGVIVVAAGPADDQDKKNFPSTMQSVIGVVTTPPVGSAELGSNTMLFAPGNEILVAVPTDRYDFRSGSSLAAAHVSGVVALLLSAAPNQSPETIRGILQRSQARGARSMISVNACTALNLAVSSDPCISGLLNSEWDLDREHHPRFGPIGGADDRYGPVGIVNPKINVSPVE